MGPSLGIASDFANFEWNHDSLPDSWFKNLGCVTRLDVSEGESDHLSCTIGLMPGNWVLTFRRFSLDEGHFEGWFVRIATTNGTGKGEFRNPWYEVVRPDGSPPGYHSL